MAIRAAIFDFNGTISDDEPVLERLFRDMSRQLGRPLTRDEYYRELAGLSDRAIVECLLRRSGEAVDERRREALLRGKIDRYKAIVSTSPPVREAAAACVRAVARRVPVAIASGAPREEVEYVLGISGLTDVFAAVVCIEDVACGKPDPEGFCLALARLNRRLDATSAIMPGEVVVVEDADAGVQAAKAAGMRCAALATDAYTGAAAKADAVFDRLAPAMVDDLLRLDGEAAQADR